MPVSASFKAFVMEQLGRTTPGVYARSMFGGIGLYAGDMFFALIAEDTLYFKVDDTTRPAYVERGLEPFRPFGEHGATMAYYRVAEDLLEDAAALAPWVTEAMAVARRAKRRAKGRPKGRA